MTFSEGFMKAYIRQLDREAKTKELHSLRNELDLRRVQILQLRKQISTLEREVAE